MTRWAQRERELEEVRTQAEARVVRWLYGSVGGRWHEPRPLWEERSGGKPAPAPRPEPKAGKPQMEYGLTVHGEVVIARTREADGSVKDDEVAITRSDGVEWRLMQYRPPNFPEKDRVPPYLLQRVIRIYWDNDRRPVRSVTEISKRSRVTELYAYDSAGRIASIDVTSEGPVEELSAGFGNERYLVAYDDDGQLASITVEDAEGSGVVYGQLVKPLKDYAKDAAEQLTEAVARAVVSSGRHEPVAVAVMAADYLLPPLVAIAGESEWKQAQQRWVPDLGGLWNAAHLDFRLEDTEEFDFPDRATFDAAALALEQEGDDSDFEALFVDVAQRLNARDWPAGTVSEDFAAIAVEASMDDLRDWAKRSLPAHRFAELAAEKLL